MSALTVAGLMSGTSADGVDVAFVRIGPELTGLTLLHHRAAPFPALLREAVLAAQDARQTTTAALARLNWRLGLAYAEAYRDTLAEHPARIDLVGCHGQTVYHQAVPAEHLGANFACTWQIGEMAPLAREAGVPVYSNFRPADLLAGGQGAPLVPLLDQALYRHPTRTRVLQNIGGIGNLTVVPPLGSTRAVQAFDTGPGNMVLDALARELFGLPYDPEGSLAGRGRVLGPVVDELLREPFFLAPPPKTAGREQFGAAFTARLLGLCRALSQAPEDALATAAALTARSIAPAMPAGAFDLILSGGGARNLSVRRMLQEALPEAAIMNSDDPALPTPLPVEAKEAVAFALLAYMSHHRLPGNVPSATGAREAVVLGQVTCA